MYIHTYVQVLGEISIFVDLQHLKDVHMVSCKLDQCRDIVQDVRRMTKWTICAVAEVCLGVLQQ